MGLRQAAAALGMAAFATFAVAQNTYQEAVQMMVDCTVTVIDGDTHAAGVVINEHHILTSQHMVEDSKELTVRTSDGELLKAVVIRVSEKYDVALLGVEKAPKCGAVLGKELPPMYSTLWTVGFPLDPFVPIVSVGLYQGPVIPHKKYNMIASTNTWMGNSGGGLFFINKRGKLEIVGIVEAVLWGYRTLLNYLSDSVSITQINEFLGEKK